MQSEAQTVVVGAGIVGICTALYLQDKGRQVTLVDRLAPGEGTSSGNAGIISVGSVHPEAMPGIWKEIPHMLLQRQADQTGSEIDCSGNREETAVTVAEIDWRVI